jgi:pectate lyase
MRRLGIYAIAMSVIAFSVAFAQRNQPPVSAGDVLEEGLRLSATMTSSQVQCATPNHWPGLTVQNGHVIGADMLKEIGGYAREAKVTGGLGGELHVVTSTLDYDPQAGEKPIAGSLRAELSAGSNRPRWIVFALEPGAKIRLKSPLRLSDNVTLDGSCSDVTLEAISTIGLVYVFGQHNVVIARLAFRHSDYVEGSRNETSQTCIRLNGLVDAVAIIHNDLSRCGDGTIDITTSPGKPVPELARITISYNRFSRHDKVMLFGTFTCGPTGRDDEPCDSRELEHNRNSTPGLFLTLNSNLFYRTTQRHPRIFGRVMAHVVGNVIAFTSYGTFVSNGARALVEDNIYLMTGRRDIPNRAVWTTTTPGALKMPWDVEGFIRASHNRTVGQAIVNENHPGLVPDPGYPGPLMVPGFANLSLPKAIACVAARAGTRGPPGWPASCQQQSP